MQPKSITAGLITTDHRGGVEQLKRGLGVVYLSGDAPDGAGGELSDAGAVAESHAES